MAEENEEGSENEESTEEAGSASGGGKKKWIIFILAAVIVLSACVFGTLWALGVFDGGDEAAEEEGEGAVAEEQQALNKPPPAMYFPVKPAFIVNFSTRGRQRFLQADVTIMTRDTEVFTALQTHLPLIKNRLVMLFSGEVYEELQTDEGKELLRQKSTEALQELLQQEVGKSGVEEVLFTNFVMQ